MKMATIERHQPGSYYTERSSYYGHYPNDKEIIVKEERPKCGKCAWILAAIFIVFIILLIICLIIFFVWGAAYFNGPGATNAPAPQGLLSLPGNDALLDQSGLKLFNGVHFDLDLPKYVLNALKTGQPKICVLDTAFLTNNYKDLFSQEHIPGARHFDIGEILKTRPDGTVQLPHPLEFQSYARSLGIDNDCHVVVYDHSEDNNAIVTATFAWWLFKLYGHYRVTVMNGGLKEWKKFTANEANYQVVSSGPKAIQQGDLKAGWYPKWIITYPDVLSKVQDKKTQLVDSRDPNEFSGAVKPTNAKESGRIKNAINFAASQVVNSDGALKGLQDIKEMFKTKKLDPVQSSVVYDDSAMYASLVYFAMVQAGYDVRLYGDGWKDWAEKAPIEYKERG